MKKVMDQNLTQLFLRRVLATREGRAFMLNQCAQAEASDEGKIFDSLAEKVDDPELRKLVRIHQQDELRHAEMFNACLARQGGTPTPVPAGLRLMDRLAAKLGDIFARPVTGAEGVMEHYLLLQVIEERAMTQFAIFERAFRAVDPETADVFVAVAKDEERHLKYCHAIARRYASDEKAHHEMLQHMRQRELEAFTDNSRAVMLHLLETGLARVGWLEDKIWRGLSMLTTRRMKKQRTAFWEGEGEMVLT